MLFFFIFKFSLVKAYDDLNEYLTNEEELKEQPEFGAAKEILQAAKEKIDGN